MVAIDLTWLKPEISGGIEFYTRNLLRGLAEVKTDRKYIVLLSKDNTVIENDFSYSNRFIFHICDSYAFNLRKRLVWQNLHLSSLLKKLNVKVCITPFYSVPLIKSKAYKSITVIHDLQAFHYPQYFSSIKKIWLKLAWKRSLENSDIVLTISNFCKSDILHFYGQKYSDKVRVLYNPIDISKYSSKESYNKRQDFFYTICSKFKHKNFITLVELIHYIVMENLPYPKILYVTGMKEFPEEIQNLINKYKLNGNIILTGYISDEERNRYYQNCKVFLFPSLFEGFGMPVVEAMLLKTPVVTTNLTSIPEVSMNKAIYVDNPFSIEMWIEGIKNALSEHYVAPEIYGNPYHFIYIAEQYLNIIKELEG